MHLNGNFLKLNLILWRLPTFVATMLVFWKKYRLSVCVMARVKAVHRFITDSPKSLHEKVKKCQWGTKILVCVFFAFICIYI